MKQFFHSIRTYLIIFFICSIIMTGCSPAPTFMRPDFEKKQIRTIAIMPVTDKRDSPDNKAQSNDNLLNIEELLSKKIIDKNYDIISPELVKNIIKEKTIENMSPKNLCSTLNVDGILYSELFDYTDIFYINHSIKIDFKIYDAKGDSLWINNLDASNRPFLEAIGASIGWAIGISLDNKISSKDKTPKILIGAASALVGYTIIDGILNEISMSIDRGLKTLPEGNGSGKKLLKDIIIPVADKRR
jgi:hypothetical protein